jgi:hypothetical protein
MDQRLSSDTLADFHSYKQIRNRDAMVIDLQLATEYDFSIAFERLRDILSILIFGRITAYDCRKPASHAKN